MKAVLPFHTLCFFVMGFSKPFRHSCCATLQCHPVEKMYTNVSVDKCSVVPFCTALLTVSHCRLVCWTNIWVLSCRVWLLRSSGRTTPPSLCSSSSKYLPTVRRRKSLSHEAVGFFCTTVPLNSSHTTCLTRTSSFHSDLLSVCILNTVQSVTVILRTTAHTTSQYWERKEYSQTRNTNYIVMSR